MGLLDSADNLVQESTISQEEAEVLSSALDHSYYEEAAEEDSYFTPEEYRRYSGGLSRLCHKYALRSRGAVENNVGISAAETGALLDEYKVCSRVCQCPAHQMFRASSNIRYNDCIGRLISLPAVLTDHYGSELVEALFPFLFQ